MSKLDELISGEISKYQESAISDIQAKAYQERQFLDEYAFSLAKESDSLLGFKLGALAPAYKTENASVYVRDPLGLQESYASLGENAPASDLKSLVFVAAVLMAFLYLRRR